MALNKECLILFLSGLNNNKVLTLSDQLFTKNIQKYLQCFLNSKDLPSYTKTCSVMITF